MANTQEEKKSESFAELFEQQIKVDEKKEGQVVKAVSYTHLTLPTNREV